MSRRNPDYEPDVEVWPRGGQPNPTVNGRDECGQLELLATAPVSYPPELVAAWKRFSEAHAAWVRTLSGGAAHRTRHEREDQELAWQAFCKERRAWRHAVEVHRP